MIQSESLSKSESLPELRSGYGALGKIRKRTLRGSVLSAQRVLPVMK